MYDAQSSENDSLEKTVAENELLTQLMMARFGDGLSAVDGRQRCADATGNRVLRNS